MPMRMSEHEQEVARSVCGSAGRGACRVLERSSEFREYERLSSTIVNAYLMPIAREYLRRSHTKSAASDSPSPFT